MLTQAIIHKAGRIDQIVRDFFEHHRSVKEISSKELMPLFISKGIFKSNHRDRLPIRNFLRKLDSEKMLGLLTHVKVVRNAVNRNWYFKK
jgi:hypothetical protein